MEENGTVGNLDKLFRAAKAAGIKVFVSPHYYYPADHDWEFGGTLEKKMHEIGMIRSQGSTQPRGF